ncbi:hypothetical protein GCM10010407_00650 [Rarobacter incanus]
MPKSGTTAIQFSAAKLRPELLQHGVRYPGTGHNHSLASFAVARKRRGWQSGAGRLPIVPMEHWNSLVTEISEDPGNRIFVSHEYFAERSIDVGSKIVSDIPRGVHVVFTIRNQPSLLSSAWQEYLKSGATETIDEWLEIVLNGAPHKHGYPSFARRSNLSENVSKWAALVGPENVTVVVLDKKDRGLLNRSFEQLLALPQGFFERAKLSGRQENRSMTRIEADLVRAANSRIVETPGLDWATFRDFHKFGAVFSLLRDRVPPKDESRIMPDRWALELMAQRAREHALQIESLGVTVVGDLANVYALPHDSGVRQPPTTNVPIDLAAQVEFGAFVAAQKWRAKQALSGKDFARFEPLATATRSAGSQAASTDEMQIALTQALGGVPTLALGRYLASRAVRSATRRLRRRVR